MNIKIRTGEVITTKEFMSKWAQGINGITPLQQAKVSIQSTVIIIIGIIFGLVISSFNIKSLYWLFIILTGALGNTSIQLLGMIQKYNQLKMFDKLQKEAQENDV